MTASFRSAAELADAIRRGEASPVGLVETYLDRIEARNDELNAFVTVLPERARERAAEAEQAIEEGADLPPLHGVPVAIKDMHQRIEGVPHTMGLAPLADNVATSTSAVVERLEAAGAVVLGTTNTPELGHTMRTYNELVGPTPTPFDPDGESNAGGSSGGSAAALAADLCALATGSDVGGSLRIPAACCGVVSVKPTLGLVPQDGRPDGFRSHTPVGVIGPLARTVEDAGLVLSVMVGRDDADPLTVDEPADDYAAAASDPAEEGSVAYSPDVGAFPVDPAVRDICDEAVDAFADAGLDTAGVDLGGPGKGDLKYAYGVEATPLFAARAARLEDEHGLDLTGADTDRVSDSLVRTIQLGQGHDAKAYLETNRVRTALYDAVEAVLADHDALVCPVTATPPLTHDEPYPTKIDGEPTGGLPMDWGLAWPFNMTGHPVVTVPAGLTDDGLPVGLQVVGGRFAEADLLSVAAALEREHPWAGTYPGA